MFLHAEKYLKSNVLQYFNLKPIAFHDGKSAFASISIAFVFYINFPLKSSRYFNGNQEAVSKKCVFKMLKHVDKHFRLHSVFDAKKAVDFIRPLKFGSPSRV